MESVADLNRRISALPQGIPFTRLATALMRTRGDLPTAARLARRWPDSPAVLTVLSAMANAGTTNLKAAVAVGDTGTAGWASQLVNYDNLVSEFTELLRPATIIGSLKGLRRVPPNVRFVTQGGGALVGWVGDGYPAPVGELSFESETLGLAKVAGIVAITKELLHSAAPEAEGLIRADLLAAVAQFLDQQFIDPAVAAVPGVSPASITHGVTPLISSGSTVAAITSDLLALFSQLIAAGIKLLSPALIMTPATALALAMKRTAADVPAFPGVTAFGGNWCGVPIITSASVPASVSGGSIVVLVDASEVFDVDDQLVIDVSEEASLQPSTNPSNGAQMAINLFQLAAVGLRVVAYKNWKMRRPGAVAVLDQVHW